MNMTRRIGLAAVTAATALLMTTGLSLAISCGKEGSIASPGTSKPVTITFKNKSKQEVTVYWLDFDGDREEYATLDTGESYTQETYKNHIWLVADEDDDCIGIWSASKNSQSVTIKGSGGGSSGGGGSSKPSSGISIGGGGVTIHFGN